MGGPGWRRLAAESSLRALRGIEKYEDFLRPQQQQKHGFRYEKAFKCCCGLDAMAKGQKEAIWAE
jgi:hypothetical protein